MKHNTKYSKTMLLPHAKKLYSIYLGARGRCRDKADNCYYRNGIKFLFKDFNQFYKWAIKANYKPGLTIDRINTYGNYCPNNCRWATHIEQCYNKKNTVRINGLTIYEISTKYNIPYKKILRRFRARPNATIKELTDRRRWKLKGKRFFYGKSIVELSNISGVKYSTIVARVNKNPRISYEDLIIRPQICVKKNGE